MRIIVSLIMLACLALPVFADDPKPHLPTPPCPNCQCGCTETGKCNCKDCDHPLLVKVDAPKESVKKVKGVACQPNDKDGCPFYGPDGCQCGWLDFKTKTYHPLDKDGCFGAACDIPAGATVTKPAVAVSVAANYQFGGTSGGCANGNCGGTTTRGFGIFRR